MSISQEFFNQSIMKEIKNEISNDFVKEIQTILNQKIHFKNYKYNNIYSTSNLQVDNPERRITPNGKSTLIIGSSGIGKTTFFDKLIHPIVSPNTVNSPINGYVTGLRINFSSEEDDMEFKFTTTSPNKIDIAIDGIDSEENYENLKSYGLIANYLTSFFFICGQIDHFHLFSHFNGIITPYKKYFYHPIDLKIIEKFESAINEFRNKIEIINCKVNTLKFSIQQYTSYIDKMKKEIQEYQLFLDNQSKIKELLIKLRSEVDYENLKAELREIQEQIKIINYKIATENQLLKDIEEKKISPKYSVEYHRFLREEYQNSPKTCHFCNKDFDFPYFVKKYESNKCFICNSNFDGYEEFFGEKYQIIKKKEQNQEGLLKYILKKDPLETKRNEIIDKIAQIESKSLSKDELALKKIMSPFFLEIKYNNFDDLVEKFTKSQISRKNLVLSYTEQIKDSREKLKKYLANISEIEDKLNFLKKYKQELLNILENDIYDTYSLFCSKISEFWHILSNISDKRIEEKNGQLYVVSVTKKSLLPVSTKITGLDPKQKRLSTNLVEILRYSLQLAFIYCISKKFNKTPLKTIIFDDPNQKYITSLIELLNSVFIGELGFQIILLTHVENITTDWEIEEFEFYDGNISTENENFLKIISQWKNDEKSKNIEKNESDNGNSDTTAGEHDYD